MAKWVGNTLEVPNFKYDILHDSTARIMSSLARHTKDTHVELKGFENYGTYLSFDFKMLLPPHKYLKLNENAAYDRIRATLVQDGKMLVLIIEQGVNYLMYQLKEFATKSDEYQQLRRLPEQAAMQAVEQVKRLLSKFVNDYAASGKIAVNSLLKDKTGMELVGQERDILKFIVPHH